MKTLAKYILSILLPVVVLASCVDDDLPYRTSIPEGETEISATISFDSFATALEGRSAGNAINSIRSLWIVIYEQTGGSDSWTLERNGKIEILAEESSASDGSRASTPEHITVTEDATGVTFRLRHKNGRYRIYAVANYDLYDIRDEEIQTPEQLKELRLTWDASDMANNAEMFGHFTNSRADVPSPSTDDDETVEVSPNRPLHAWLRRAASKVTVAYDGSRLADGVTIYIMSATIKDIPAMSRLGAENKVTETRALIPEGEQMKYYDEEITSDKYAELLPNHKLTITNQSPSYTREDPDPLHADDAEALYFYENMQGTYPDNDKRQKDTDSDGTLDYEFKDGIDCGTYIEVSAIYSSTNAARPGSGVIKYRFMLGKDITTNYDAERNHHYKLTLRFNKYANDVDWHIEYQKQVLGVTEPRFFNYQGKVFVPDPTLPNEGHNFSDVNTIMVTSYKEGTEEDMGKFEVSFLDPGAEKYSSASDWLDYTITPGDHPYDRRLNISFKKEKLEPDEEFSIDANLKAATPTGTKEVPHNLADPGGTPGKITCTANCYIVDAPGWYIFPMVYGNAVHNGAPNPSAYTSAGGGLKVFKNHLGNDIISPYINDNMPDEASMPKAAYLVWQDVQDMIRPHFDYEPNPNDSSPTYIAEAYGGKGGIRFYIDKTKISQGNAVIAVSNRPPTINSTDHTFELPEAIWSWHIWVTRFDFEEEDKTIEVTAHDHNRKFRFMPFNLGWCSESGQTIRYYKEHEVKVKISAGGEEEIISIVKKSHIAYPRGNNPYYQWGRKDPFIGANGWYSSNNKVRYNYIGWADTNNPPRLTDDSSDENAKNRPTTREALHLLIQRPDTWHNPPRKPGTNGNPWASDNETYANLWEGRPGLDPNAPILKTVYDPCPVGYQVCHYNAFTGFTTTGDNTNISDEWYDVRIQDVGPGNPTDDLYELYTNHEKYQSIIFPVTGYRDWDSFADTFQFGDIGYVWAAGNYHNDDNNSYNFEFSRKDTQGLSYVRPLNYFYPCDGFPIRPCSNGKQHGSPDE